MKSRILLDLCIVLLVSAVCVTSLVADEVKTGPNDPLPAGAIITNNVAPRAAAQRNAAPVGPITIVYDDGIVTSVPATTSFCYGNQFDSALGTPVGSFSVTGVSAFILTGGGTDNVFVSVFGPVAGTTAPLLGSPSLPLTAGSGAFNNFALGPYTGVGSFLAGIWYVAGDTVGLGSGTANGQGFHGMLINDIVGTGFQTLPGLNALVGATTAFIPVELMDFQVVDN